MRLCYNEAEQIKSNKIPHGGNMLAVERLSAITEALNVNDSVSVSELSKNLNVAEETIRRDLEKLVKGDHTVVRVHGGAYKIKTFDREAPYQLRETLLVEEKSRIAQTSLGFINEGETIMLDSSTTALHLARLIKNSTMKISIITNSLTIASTLADCAHTNLIVAGGQYRLSSRSFVGYSATNALEEYHADKAFISCSGIHEKFGLTDNSQSEAQVRRMMLDQSDHRYLLIDTDKFGRCKDYRIAQLKSMHVMITNGEPDIGLRNALEKNGAELIVC